MNKDQIRKEFFDKRLALSKKEIIEYSAIIKKHFFKNFDLTSIETIHTFLPIEKFNEIDTWQIINELKKRQNLRITVSKSDLERIELKHFILGEKSDLIRNEWGIYEPHEGEEVKPSEIDMAIIPLIAFDVHGNRIGYGKGFYDKFLSTCKVNAIKIGLSAFPPIQEIEDIAPYDIPLNHCITPERVYNFT